MTHLSAAAFAIDTLGRDTAFSTNPERDIARLERADNGTGGLWNWLKGTALARAIADRVAERQLTRAVARLTSTSPHLLADVGLIDTPAIAFDKSVRARFDAASNDVRIMAAPVPVAPRPAFRPAIAMPQRAPAQAEVKAPAPVASKPQLTAH